MKATADGKARTADRAPRRSRPRQAGDAIKQHEQIGPAAHQRVERIGGRASTTPPTASTRPPPKRSHSCAGEHATMDRKKVATLLASSARRGDPVASLQQGGGS